MKKPQIDDLSTGTRDFTEATIRNREPFGLPQQPISPHMDEVGELPQRGDTLHELIDEYQPEKQDFLDSLLNDIPHNPCPNDTSQLYFGDQLPQDYLQEDQESPQLPPSSQIPPESIAQRGSQIEKPKGKRRMTVEEEQNFYKKFKKNVNMPKAIGRYLMDYYHLFKETLYVDQQAFFEDFSHELEERKVWVRRSKKNAIKLIDLKLFFSRQGHSRRQSCLNRLMMRKIIQKFSRDEIVPNNQVKSKLEYLVATKVYALRCTNPVLATRMQMR